jgi:predicted AAA+ superfamily ATPase
MYQRKQFFLDSENYSLFFWGARQTGKSTLLKERFPDALVFDLLLSEMYNLLLRNPEFIRQTLLADTTKKVVIIDEIQRIPNLLNEVHWLIVNTDVRFILSGSSPRKIVRSETNLLGGRAIRYDLFPLSYSEIPDFNLEKALNHGLLPNHYLSKNPKKLIQAYVGNYLRDEIVQEARIRNVAAFTDFLRIACFSNGEMVNYSNIATDCGVAVNTIKEYFSIVEETLLGYFVRAFQKKAKRRVVLAPKFYFFDISIVNHLLNRSKIESGTELFGNAFEQFILMELKAHASYSGLDYSITYWRTTSGFEVDFILNDEVAIEVKASNNIQSRHLKGMLAFEEEFEVKKKIIVCQENLPRKIGNILILPWQQFLQQLWNNEIIS